MLTISAVGDIMLGDHPVRIGNGVRSALERTGSAGFFDGVLPLLRGSGVTFGNLEVVHADTGRACGRLESCEFRGAPAAIGALRDAGFTVLSVANNHCMQHGVDAFSESAAHVESAGIAPLGVRDAAGRSRAVELEAGGERLVLIGYSLRPEEHSRLADLPYCQAGEAEVLEDVRARAAAGALVIVSLHWGDEYLNYPSLAQIRLAHRLVDVGARVILGHHPHVLQGVETYRGAVIAYSLGNFVFDMWQDPTRHGMVLQVDVERGAIRGHRITPTYIYKGYRPVVSADRSRCERAQELLGEQLRRLALPESGQGAAESAYRGAARRKMLRNRFENYAFFIAHLLSYKPGYIRQSIARSLSRRRAEFGQSVRGAGPARKEGR